MIKMTTNYGDIMVELFEEEAPISTENFKNYVENGFYDGTVFHRVISGFMIQGGGMTLEMEDKKGENEPIKNEADNGLQNKRGTLAMARTQEVDSATNQFFINASDNAFLDHGERDFGYAVFGQVVEGMDVVDEIAAVETDEYEYMSDVPVEPVIIESVTAC